MTTEVDEDLNARFQARMKEISTENDLTIADRLFKRAMEQRMILTFSGDPPIQIEIRVPLSAEFDKILLYKHEMVLAGLNGKIDEQIEYGNKLIKVLAGLCVDPSLNEEFLLSGAFGIDDILSLIEAITEEAMERIKKARTFRKRDSRKKHPDALRETGEVSA